MDIFDRWGARFQYGPSQASKQVGFRLMRCFYTIAFDQTGTRDK